MGDKIPVSVLVVIHSADKQILLLERADHPGWWQSVTGSQDSGETLLETAIREVREETGLDARQYRLADWDYSNVYAIYDCYLHRYAPGTTHNTEHVYGLRLPEPMAVTLAPRISRDGLGRRHGTEPIPEPPDGAGAVQPPGRGTGAADPAGRCAAQPSSRRRRK